MSTTTWYGTFGCREAPFKKDLTPDDAWLPTALRPILAEILEAIRGHGSLSLVGESGGGKTSLLRALRHALTAEPVRLSYCHNATLGRRDFYRMLCVGLGLQPAATAAGVFLAITHHVEALARDRVHPVFCLDEAHLLHQDTLDHLHSL